MMISLEYLDEVQGNVMETTNKIIIIIVIGLESISASEDVIGDLKRRAET